MTYKMSGAKERNDLLSFVRFDGSEKERLKNFRWMVVFRGLCCCLCSCCLIQVLILVPVKIYTAKSLSSERIY